MADIAAAADIAPRTFFAYFPSKEAVVFHDFDALFGSLKATIEGTAGGRDRDRRAAPVAGGTLPAQHDESPESELRKRMCIDEPRARRASAAPDRQASRRSCASASRGTSGSRRTRCSRGWSPPRRSPRSSAIEHDGAGDKSKSMALLDETLVFLRGGVAALQARSA